MTGRLKKFSLSELKLPLSELKLPVHEEKLPAAWRGASCLGPVRA